MCANFNQNSILQRKLQMLMRYQNRSGAAEQQDQFLSEYNNPIYAPTTTQSGPEEIPLQSIRSYQERERSSNDYY
jgi:hypothetical protein